MMENTSGTSVAAEMIRRFRQEGSFKMKKEDFWWLSQESKDEANKKLLSHQSSDANAPDRSHLLLNPPVTVNTPSALMLCESATQDQIPSYNDAKPTLSEIQLKSKYLISNCKELLEEYSARMGAFGSDSLEVPSPGASQQLSLNSRDHCTSPSASDVSALRDSSAWDPLGTSNSTGGWMQDSDVELSNGLGDAAEAVGDYEHRASAGASCSDLDMTQALQMIMGDAEVGPSSPCRSELADSVNMASRPSTPEPDRNAEARMGATEAVQADSDGEGSFFISPASSMHSERATWAAPSVIGETMGGSAGPSGAVGRVVDVDSAPGVFDAGQRDFERNAGMLGGGRASPPASTVAEIAPEQCGSLTPAPCAVPSVVDEALVTQHLSDGDVAQLWARLQEVRMQLSTLRRLAQPMSAQS